MYQKIFTGANKNNGLKVNM